MPKMSSLQLEQLSIETMQMAQKSATAGIYAGTGVQGVDLGRFTSLVPVNVPARNNTMAFPRVIAGEGAPMAWWQTWLNLNASQSSGAVGVDYAGSMTEFQAQQVYAPYRPLAKAGRVTLDAQSFARNYVDDLSQAEMQTLNQLFIVQDMNIINSQGWALPPVGVVALTPSTTGGSLATGTVYVRVAARSGANFYDGGSGPAGTEYSVGVTGSTGSVIATWAAVKGAVAYDVYAGGAAGGEYYLTTVTAATVTITALPTSGTSNPVPQLGLMSTLRPGAGCLPLANPAVAGNGLPPTVDNSYSANYYNGVIASTLGDYGALGPVTPGSGTPSGGIFIDNGGKAPQLSGGGIDILDTVNAQIWAAVQLSPTAYMLNSEQAEEISAAILTSGSATTFLPPTDADARTNLAGGGYIGRYINRAAGGVPVQLEVHPRVPPGTIVARTDRVPFPASGIGTVFEVRCQYDSMRFDYAANYNPGVLGGGARYDFEVRSMETLVNRAPLAQAIVSNIG